MKNTVLFGKALYSTGDRTRHRQTMIAGRLASENVFDEVGEHVPDVVVTRAGRNVGSVVIVRPGESGSFNRRHFGRPL